ncbi:hypothetical protein GmHk_15G042665 [Glycine max]|nr:hypothetical protein GmHk_15G042665 [Glycine max]
MAVLWRLTKESNSYCVPNSRLTGHFHLFHDVVLSTRQVTVWGLRSSYKDIVQREHRSDSLCSEMIGMADKAMQIYASMIGLLLLLPPISSLSPYRSDIYKHDLVETLKQDCLHYVDSPHARTRHVDFV